MKRTPLNRKSALQRGGRINPVSRKRRYEADTRQAVVTVTLARAGHQCEARGLVPEVQCGGPLDVDERVARGVRPGAHLDVSITQVLCRNHHSWKHQEPYEAHQRGLTFFSWEYTEAQR